MTTQQILQGVHDWTNGKIVYDISVAHPDGRGKPTPYADLTDAIGINGANIPDALRKGGMSIRFVQSSDNKYVQYRLMNTAWSTTVDDWQEIGSSVISDKKMDEVLGGEIAVYLTDANNTAVLDDNGKPIEII